MGRPPSNGGPSFRFSQPEVAEMEAILQAHKTAMPAREILIALAEKFSKSEERSGKIEVQMKQVWNWFQNRRYAIRAKAAKSPGKLNATPMAREDSAINNVPQATQQLSASSAAVRPLPQASQHPTGPPAAVRAFPQSTQHPAAFSGRVADNSQMEYEAKSARDGAWYDVATFLSHRSLETGDPEVLVRFAGFGAEEDEWVNVKKNVRQRSLPCESSECVAVLPADLILCFQEGKEQALYFDAHVLDAQRRRHDVRGCRCRFLVRYDHDQSEEIVALRKICRRPETDYRLQQLHAVNDPLSANQNKNGANNIHTVSTLRVYPPAETPTKHPKVEHAVLSPAEVPQKRQKVDSTVPALLPEEPQRQCKVEPVLLTASGEVPQNQCKVEPASAPAPSPNVAQNQHKLQPVLSMPSAQASLEPHKVEPVVTALSTLPLIERQKVESVEPAQPSLQQQEAKPLVSSLLAEVPVKLHQLQEVVPVLSTEASAEPQEVKTMIPSPSAKVTPELQTVQPIIGDRTVEPMVTDQTVEPVVADQTVEPVTTDQTVVADTSAEVLQDQHKVEPAPSAEPMVEPHRVESTIPAISTEVSFESQAAESAVPPSTEVSLEQHKLQSDASSSKLLVEPHKVESAMPVASAEVPVEPHKEPIVVAMGSALTDPLHPDAPEVNEIELEQPVPSNGEVTEAESSSIMENWDIRPENVDIEQAKVVEIGNIDNVENSIVPSENC